MPNNEVDRRILDVRRLYTVIVLATTLATAAAVAYIGPVRSAAVEAAALSGDVVTSTKFSGDGKGTAPAGWSPRWSLGQRARVLDRPRRMQYTLTTSGRQLLTFDKVGRVSGDVEVAGLVRVPPPAKTSTQFQLHLSASDAAPVESYYLDVRQGQIRINQNVEGSFSVGSTAEFGEFSPDTWYNVRFLRRGDALRGKVWEYGEAEPADWMVEHHDSRLSGGRVGVGHVGDATMADWAWFSVGTGSASAEAAPADLFPMPRVPEQLTSVTAEPAYGGILLSWDDDPDATYFDVERDGELLTRRWPEVSYVDPLTRGGEGATYRVRAVDAEAGPGPWSDPIDARSAPLPAENRLPFEGDPSSGWTSLAAEEAFLTSMARTSRADVDLIGESEQGRPMRLVRIGLDGPPTDRELAAGPTVLVGCSIHGNEPAPREACLATIRTLATSETPKVRAFLDEYNVAVIPTMNPDGRAANVRGLPSQDNVDPNRDNLALTYSETRVLASVQKAIRPLVTLDLHEWSANAYGKPELEVQQTGSLNVHADLRDEAYELGFRELVANAGERGGTTAGPYGWPNSPGYTFKNSATLKHSLGILAETRRPSSDNRREEAGLSLEDPEVRLRRVAGQRYVLAQTMDFLQGRSPRLEQVRDASISSATSNSGALYLGGSLVEEPAPADIIDPPPCGWILTRSDAADKADELALHGIRRRPIHPTDQGQLPEELLRRAERKYVFVPAAQRQRSVALLALDPESPEAIAPATRVIECPVGSGPAGAVPASPGEPGSGE